MSRLPLARVTHRKCQIAANFLVLQRAEAADNRDREERGERGGGRRLSGGISASLWLETGAAFASFILSADLKILPDHTTAHSKGSWPSSLWKIKIPIKTHLMFSLSIMWGGLLDGQMGYLSSLNWSQNWPWWKNEGFLREKCWQKRPNTDAWCKNFSARQLFPGPPLR